MPRLCFVGPMLGKHRGWVTTQGQILSELFASAGYPVMSVSSVANRYLRLLDMLARVAAGAPAIDIVVLDVFGGPSFVVEDAVSRLARLLRKPLVMVLRGGALPDFLARYPRWARRVLCRAQAIVAPSPYLARAVESYGLEARVIPNVIRLGQYPFRPRRRLEPRLLWMRTFHSVWNPALAVRTLAVLRRDFPDATLVMAGQDKGLEAETRRLAASLGLDGLVRFPGFLKAEDKIREGGRADVFINTNRIDNTPVAVLEASALGLPVVATDVGGLGDLLQHGRTALLTPDDDHESMASAIASLLRDAQLAETLSRNGRALAESFAWERVRPRWETLFSELCAAPAPVLRPTT